MKRRTFGSIRQLPSGRWQARYRDGEGAMRTAEDTFATKAEADHWLATTQHELRSGQWVDPDRGDISVAEWSIEWLRIQMHLKPKSRYGYESLLRSRLLPELGDLPVRHLRTSHIQSMVASFQLEGLSASRTRQAVALLSQILDAAIADGLIRSNPCRAVRQPRLPEREMRAFTAAEVDRIAESITPAYRSLVHVLAYGGLRWGEAAGLTRSSVDIDARRLRITRSIAEAGGELFIGTTKTHQQRGVVLPTFLWADLAAYLKRNVDDTPEAILFPAAAGGFLRYSNFIGRHWQPALSKAGLEPCGLHVLRHTCASLLAAAGAPVKAIQVQLGHASAEMTLNRYSHLYPDDLDELATHLDAIRRRADLSRRLSAPRPGPGEPLGR